MPKEPNSIKPIESSYVISRAHHPDPQWIGPYRIALRLNGTGFDLLDMDANVIDTGTVSGIELVSIAQQLVRDGQRYKD